MATKKIDIRTKQISIKDIIDPALPMRGEGAMDNLESLKKSIRILGLIQPITVKQNGEKYEVVAGKRRYHAVKQLGFDSLSCIVRTAEPLAHLKLMFDENYEREDINPIEEAAFFASIIEKYQITQAQLAIQVDRTPAYVSERIAIMDYPACLR